MVSAQTAAVASPKVNVPGSSTYSKAVSSEPGLYNLTRPRASAAIQSCILYLASQLSDPLGGAFAPVLSSSRKLAGPTDGPDPSKAEAVMELNRLKALAKIYGLSRNEAHACVRLALGQSVEQDFFTTAAANRRKAGSGNPSKVMPTMPNVSLGSSLLRLIVPRPGVEYGKDLVLDLLGCLGPAPGVLEDKRYKKMQQRSKNAAGLEKRAGDDDEDEEAGEEAADVKGTEEEKKKKGDKPLRRHVHLKVQAQALKLLILLLDVPALQIQPSASVTAGTSEKNEPDSDLLLSQLITLPTSFLTAQARRQLDQSFGILFHFIEYTTLRNGLCYLLCKLARRKHVKSYRVTKLLSLRALFPEETCNASLLAVFGNFYPDLLFPDLVNPGGGGGGRAMGASMNLGLLSGGGVPPPGLKYPDLVWLVSVVELFRHPHGLPPPEPVAEEDAGNDTTAEDDVPALKRRKIAAGGPLTSASAAAALLAATSDGGESTSHLTGSGGSRESVSSIQIPSGAVISVDPSSLIISELPSIRSLGMALDRLQLPAQLASALQNRLVRLAMLVDDQINMFESVAEWCVSAIEDELAGLVSAPASASATVSGANGPAWKRVQALVKKTHSFFGLAGELAPVLSRWLYDSLAAAATAAKEAESSSRGGASFEPVRIEALLPLVTLLRPDTPAKMEARLLSPLLTLFRSPRTSRRLQLGIVQNLTGLVHNWSGFDWSRALKRGHTAGTKDDAGGDVASDVLLHPLRYGLAPLTTAEAESAFESIDSVAQRLVYCAQRLLVAHPKLPKVQASVLDAHETLSGARLNGLHTCVLPSTTTTLLLVLAENIYASSRLFSLTQMLRRSFETWEFAQDELLELQQQQDQGLTLSQVQQQAANSREGRLKVMEQTYYDEANREDLNRMVVVLADLIWRVKGFATVDDENGVTIGLGKGFMNSFRNYCDDRGESATMTGSLTQGHAFVSLAEQFMSELLISNGWPTTGDGGDEITGRAVEMPIRVPISQQSLKVARTRHPTAFPANIVWTEYRAKFLAWLEAKGASGLNELLSAIMSSLRPQSQSQPMSTPAATGTGPGPSQSQSLGQPTQ